MTLVLIETKALFWNVLEGWVPSKIKVSWVKNLKNTRPQELPPKKLKSPQLEIFILGTLEWYPGTPVLED